MDEWSAKLKAPLIVVCPPVIAIDARYSRVTSPLMVIGPEVTATDARLSRFNAPSTIVSPARALLSVTLPASATKALGPLSVDALSTAIVVIWPLANSNSPGPLTALPLPKPPDRLMSPSIMPAAPVPAVPLISSVENRILIVPSMPSKFVKPVAVMVLSASEAPMRIVPPLVRTPSTVKVEPADSALVEIDCSRIR